MRILVVEDEIELAEILQSYLHKNQFEVTLMHDGANATETIVSGNWDLVLLDLMLPNKDGLDICVEVRKQTDVPIIMMTAKVEEVDRLIGLKLGADDYICKPYSPREVVARVEAVLRRTRRIEKPTKDQTVSLDRDTMRFYFKGQPCELTAVEFNIMETLMTKPHRIYSRGQLMDRAYSDNRIVNDRTIDSHINKLRKKLTKIVGDDIIHSVYGSGYKIELPNL